ncbi:MAG: protein-L-isoaspartate(D-aspartate) O-methyltransferase [Patescibacteria group bacterium]|nr:protein-L-isoaspartate(D-aspartate) O-methyltransferase [Patescibacteria group bacterium]
MINSNKSLVNHLIENGVLRSKSIIEAFLKIDRKDFVLEEYHDQAYNDYPLPIGYGQTISQPFTVAFMLELLEPKQGQKVLDIGFGSGWTTCLLASIVEPGKVYAIEIIAEIFEFGKSNIERYNFIKKDIVKVYCGDGSKGREEDAPFDRILVSASASHLPQELIDQLANNGILVIPDNHGIWKIKKENGRINKDYFHGFVFVPLVEWK